LVGLEERSMNILDTIVVEKRRELARLPEVPATVESLRAAVAARGGVRDFAGALRSARGGMGLIAEVKKASPSKGVIRTDFDPVRIARDYEAAGANCLSVLTDERFFQGSTQHLRAIRGTVSLPLLRKDFVIDARQIQEAVEWGADAILLIVAILDDGRLRKFHALAAEAGLAVLVEVHDEVELERARTAGARLIGVNNRDLRTFTVDLATTERLAALLSPEWCEGGGLLVAESGIHTRADVRRLAACGARAILVGESLMREPDVGAKVREFLAPETGAGAG
jgi:indole-3-glycerol phosphate synthase